MTLLASIKKHFEADPNNKHLPPIEHMDSLLPPEWCAIQLELAHNHPDPEPILAELRSKKPQLEERIQQKEQNEADAEAEIKAQEQINGGRMTLRQKLLVAGVVATLPVSLPIAAAISIGNAASSSKMMRYNLAFLVSMEAELERSLQRKLAIAEIDAKLGV